MSKQIRIDNDAIVGSIQGGLDTQEDSATRSFDTAYTIQRPGQTFHSIQGGLDTQEDSATRSFDTAYTIQRPGQTFHLIQVSNPLANGVENKSRIPNDKGRRIDQSARSSSNYRSGTSQIPLLSPRHASTRGLAPIPVTLTPDLNTPGSVPPAQSSNNDPNVAPGQIFHQATNMTTSQIYSSPAPLSYASPEISRDRENLPASMSRPSPGSWPSYQPAARQWPNSYFSPPQTQRPGTFSAQRAPFLQYQTSAPKTTVNTAHPPYTAPTPATQGPIYPAYPYHPSHSLKRTHAMPKRAYLADRTDAYIANDPFHPHVHPKNDQVSKNTTFDDILLPDADLYENPWASTTLPPILPHRGYQIPLYPSGHRTAEPHRPASYEEPMDNQSDYSVDTPHLPGQPPDDKNSSSSSSSNQSSIVEAVPVGQVPTVVISDPSAPDVPVPAISINPNANPNNGEVPERNASGQSTHSTTPMHASSLYETRPESQTYGQISEVSLPYSLPDLEYGYIPSLPIRRGLSTRFGDAFRRTFAAMVRKPYRPEWEVYMSSQEYYAEDRYQMIVIFIGTTLPREVYLNFLLRLPSLYFSRVARIFEEADLTLPEIKKMALQTASPGKVSQFDIRVLEPSNVPPQYERLKSTWESFIDSIMREWKTFNIISVLLLSAILTILQIESAASDPVTRYAALFSLICALISLLFGCVYIIRFSSMRKTYKAAEWALEAKKSKTTIWWNVWVLLAMPAIWLTWSIVLYIICILSFIWRTSSRNDTNPVDISDTDLLALRIVLTAVFGLGMVYGCLILATFSRYGEVMDRAWKRRIDGWLQEKQNLTWSHRPFGAYYPGPFHTSYRPPSYPNSYRPPTFVPSYPNPGPNYQTSNSRFRSSLDESTLDPTKASASYGQSSAPMDSPTRAETGDASLASASLNTKLTKSNTRYNQALISERNGRKDDLPAVSVDSKDAKNGPLADALPPLGASPPTIVPMKYQPVSHIVGNLSSILRNDTTLDVHAESASSSHGISNHERSSLGLELGESLDDSADNRVRFRSPLVSSHTNDTFPNGIEDDNDDNYQTSISD